MNIKFIKIIVFKNSEAFGSFLLFFFQPSHLSWKSEVTSFHCIARNGLATLMDERADR